MNTYGFTKKIALVGTGFVGMSFAYAMLCESVCDELVLIDVNKQKAEGEAMDLNHGLSFAKTNMKIYAGSYTDCTFVIVQLHWPKRLSHRHYTIKL